MVAGKIEATYTAWLDDVDVKNPKPQDVQQLFELAYQIYLAKQTGQKQWQTISGGKWLADKLTLDGRFSNHQINRLSYMLDDLVHYNHWLFKRNNEQ